jgi:hypothetical protein
MIKMGGLISFKSAHFCPWRLACKFYRGNYRLLKMNVFALQIGLQCWECFSGRGKAPSHPTRLVMHRQTYRILTFVVSSFGLRFVLLPKSSILPPVMSFGSDFANNYRGTSIIGGNISDCYILFLGAFAKLRKAAISFVMSVCPSVRPSAWKNSASNGHI